MSEQKSDSGGLFFGDGLAAAAVGLLIRVAIAIWGASRFLPAEDGRFYHVIAGRIANGDGYTWLWPDGVVSYAAHYPVGYPALVGALYAVFGARPIWAMLLSALLGGLSVLAAHQIAATVATRRGALLGAAAVALHPGLVFYTPALMTEGVTASLVALLGWLCVLTRRAPARRGLLLLLALGACFGIVTLVRPQLLLLAPVFGALAAPATRSRLGAAVITTALAVTVCLPWTLRNCQRMDRCVFVSANAGWNLLIGSTEGATGSWVPIEGERVPPSCRSVHGEAAKDRCFGDAALHRILEAPLGFIALTPAKLAVTFDYAGAAGWYLHASNPVLFSERHKEWLGVVETLWQRLILALSLLAVARAEGPRARVRLVLAGVLVLMLAAWSVDAYRRRITSR